MWSRFKTLDPWLYILPIFLAGCGIAGIYSITYASVGNGGGLSDLVIKQIIFVGIGIVLLLLMTFIDYRSLRGWSLVIYILAFILIITLAVLPNTSPLVVKEFGAKRWLQLGFFQFQPSEITKMSIIIALASIFSKVHGTLRWRRLIFALVITAVPLLLVVSQPDLGTAIIIFLSSTIIISVAGLEKIQWITLTACFLMLVAIFILSFYRIKPFQIILKDYQRERIVTFINPDKDPEHKGYNILQSVIAVGSGGLTGRGLGYGSQSQLYFLPVAHSDFIFASLAESWGFLGAVGIIVIYGVLLSRIILAINIAKDRFGALLATGIFAMLLCQILINIGMNIRLFPVTGIPLPLLSSGGTSILSTFFLLGIVQSIILRYKKINF